MSERQLVTRTALAKMSGVTISGVSKAVSRTLFPAIVGRKIDAKHPLVVKFINSTKQRNAAESESNAEQKARDRMFDGGDSKVDKYLDLTLREIMELFGTDEEFANWLKAVKLIEEVKERRIKNEVALGHLIYKDFVKTHILALIETTNLRLLSDAPRTIASRVINALEADETREAIEKMVGDLLSVQLKGIKLRAVRALQK